MSRTLLACTILVAILGSLAAAADWPQWGGTSQRNNTADGKNIPVEWNVGGFDRKTRAWKKEKSQNIKWVANLGSQTNGSPVVAGGRVYVGTNNSGQYLKRYGYTDLGCCLCFRETDGKFLWQFSGEKLPTGLANDWMLMGIFGSPLVEGDRLWLVSNRCEVVCLDTQGFHDHEDDGPVQGEWISQFSVEPLVVQYGLADGAVSDSLAALFERAGVKLDWAVAVEVVDPDKKWIIRRTERGEPKEPLAQVRIEKSNVVGSQLLPKGEATEVKDLFSVDARLTLGLDERQLSAPLRAHFSRSGVELPARAAAEPVESGKRWDLRTVIDGALWQFRLHFDGERLTCQRLLTPDDLNEADVVWRFDMIKELNVYPHHWSPCSVTAWGDTLFVCTSNGVDETLMTIPQPEAPSFLALDKRTGNVLWTDNSPGDQILHAQWSSPAVGVLGGVPQVIFAGGDGWLYSFRSDRWKDKKPELLWKFDGNPKESLHRIAGRGTRNQIVAMPVIHDGLVYLAMGQDPEFGWGPADLWCIDPTKRGDVSCTLAVRADDHRKLIPRRRIQAVDVKQGEAAIANPNSAAVWHYDRFDQNGDGKIQHEETFHRSRGSPAIKDGLLLIGDFEGVMHCLDAKTGKVHWTYDQQASTWGSPLIVDNKVYVADEDGDVTVFGLSARREEAFRKSKGEFEPLAEINMERAVYTTPIVAHNVLFIANQTHLFAIEAPRK